MQQADKSISRLTRKAQEDIAKSFVKKAAGIISKKVNKPKTIKEGLNQTFIEIQKEGVSLKRIEKTFLEIDKNIRAFRILTLGVLALNSLEIQQIEPKRAGKRQRPTASRIEEKQKPKKQPGLIRLLFTAKVKKRPPTRLKTKPRPPRKKIKASARKRIFNRKLRNVLTRLKAKIAQRSAKLRGLQRYRASVEASRVQRRLERIRFKEEARLARERLLAEQNRRLTQANNDSNRVRTQAAEEANRVRTQAAEEANRVRTQAAEEANRVRTQAEAESRERLTSAESQAQTRLVQADTEARSRLAAAESESRERIDTANRQVQEANRRVQQLNEDVERLYSNRQQAINDAAEAQRVVREARAELNRVQNDTTIAATERDRIVQRQQELIREYESSRVTLRDQAARLENERQLLQTQITEAQSRVSSLQSAADDLQRAEQRRIQNLVASGQVLQEPTIQPVKPTTKPPEAGTPRPTPAPPSRPAPTPAPVAPVKPIINKQEEIIARKFAQSRILTETALLVRRKAPIIGLAIAGGIIVWELIQGKVTQAAITAAETLDPTWFGVTAATILPRIKLETYQETFGLDPNIDPENPGGQLYGERYKKISDIVDEEWEKTKKKLQESLDKKKREWKEKWKRDLENPREVIRQSIRRDGLTVRERREQQRQEQERQGGILTPGQGSVPVNKPPLGSILLPDAKVGDAIKKAAEIVGVSEAILLAMAKQESSFRADARVNTSSARGLFQFLDSTWNDMIKKYGKDYPQLLAGPYDALASSIAGALYIKENSKILENAGLEVNATNIYALHFLGPGGGRRLLSADKKALAADILPQAAKANKNVFYELGDITKPKTVQQVIDFLYRKVGDQAEQYSLYLNQNKIGSDINQTSQTLAMARPTQPQGKNIVIVSNNTNFLGAKGKPSSYSSQNATVG